ncbi:hypothetical protein CEQ90_14485 [Lewinellaceae bacterium SD302]|nr:hypothetical protein CEQ90_14485 [Lewinellaceae bacterium SD302]
MNRFFYLILLFAAAIGSIAFSLPWYVIGLLAIVAALPFRLRRRSGFWFPYIATLFVYGTYLTYVQIRNEGIMADRMGELFQVGSGWIMVIIAAVWGAFTAGLGGWLGVCLRKAVMEK